MIRPLTNAQRCAKFGRPRYRAAPTAGNPEGIVLLGDWERQNIVTVDVPQLIRLQRPRVRLHRLAAESFVALWAAWERGCLIGDIHRWNGSFYPRFKRGRAGGGIQSLSNHTWGTAFDIDAHKYPLGQHVPAMAPVRRLVPIAEEYGWFWGGNFHSRPDGMHWEYVG